MMAIKWVLDAQTNVVEPDKSLRRRPTGTATVSSQPSVRKGKKGVRGGKGH